MTDEMRANLRRATVRFAIESILRHEGMGWPWKLNVSAPDGIEPEEALAAPSPQPLTTAQQLALSVLLDEAPANVLAEYLLDQGHEYAVAVAEKAREEERGRCVNYLHGLATAGRGYSNRDATAALRHAALWIAGMTTHPSTPPATS